MRFLALLNVYASILNSRLIEVDQPCQFEVPLLKVFRSNAMSILQLVCVPTKSVLVTGLDDFTRAFTLLARNSDGKSFQTYCYTR